MMGTLKRGGRIAGCMLGLAIALAAVPADAARPRLTTPDAAPARGLPDNQLSPLSLQMLAAGEAQLGARNTAEAIQNFEAALAADPRNRRAYIGLARAAEANGLPGRAIRYYREALQIDPNDLTALELQGIALVERGAKSRAEENLSRVKALCEAPCAPADRLAAAIAKGPAPKPEQTAGLQKSPQPAALPKPADD